MKIRLSQGFVRRAFFFQISAALLLALLSFTVAYLKWGMGRDHLLGFFHQFYADDEANLPNWYSASVILVNALLLWTIALARKHAGDRLYRYWGGLALIFVFLSLDEIASLHNMADAPVRALFNTSGYFYLAWVIPYALFALIVGVGYLRLLRSIPKPVAFLIVLSGALYVAAAAGMEMIEAPIAQTEGFNNIKFAMISTVEECIELIAMAVFNYGLLRYILHLVDCKVSFPTDYGLLITFVSGRGSDGA